MTPPPARAAADRPLLVVMGVSGVGKSTVGAALAARLRLPFADADDLHSAADVAAMRAGRPLEDADREPWLDRVGAWLAGQDRDGGVIACSALRRTHRDRLRRAAPGARFVHLAAPPELVARRLAGRTGHFMPASLLASQLATLEPLGEDEPGWTVPVGDDPDRTAAAIAARLPLSEGPGPGG